MQKVTILCVGKLKEKFYIDASAEYLKRFKSIFTAAIEPIAVVVLVLFSALVKVCSYALCTNVCNSAEIRVRVTAPAACPFSIVISDHIMLNRTQSIPAGNVMSSHDLSISFTFLLMLGIFFCKMLCSAKIITKPG